VEGLAILDGPVRYLVASAQGIHRAALFRLDGEAMPTCEALVEIAPGTVDGVTETDGLDVAAGPVGPGYPEGLLVMMDDQNAGFTTNFKLIGWDGIAAGLTEQE
jgi:3-phytase